jgi:DNA-binding NarL/FixJ family response regulator
MNGEKTRVLVVEDEYMSAQFFKMSLEQNGYEVVGTATTSQEAIEHAMAKAPDVVCMDIGLESPGAGIDVARRIREISEAAIIFVSGYQDSLTKDRAMELRPAGYLVKPINIAHLIAAIEGASARP